jgi:hypothetical protein
LLTYEIDADGGDVGFGVCIVGEPQKQARLSDTGITDEEELEEVVVSVVESVGKARGGAEARSLGGGNRERENRLCKEKVSASNKAGRVSEPEAGGLPLGIHGGQPEQVLAEMNISERMGIEKTKGRRGSCC